MKTKWTCLPGALACVMLCGVAGATPLVVDTWETGAENWQQSQFGPNDPGTTLTDPSLVGGQNALRITGGLLGEDSASYISTAQTDFTGDYTTAANGRFNYVRSISFDFYAESAVPSELSLYFIGGGGLYTWSYVLNVNQGWNQYALNFKASDLGGGWGAYGRVAADFLPDLGNVTEIGVLLSYATTGIGQVYAIDNFELNDMYLVPEPSTYVVLAAAFISLAFASRGKLNELLARVRVR